jgi:hypothetical protein
MRTEPEDVAAPEAPEVVAAATVPAAGAPATIDDSATAAPEPEIVAAMPRSTPDDSMLDSAPQWYAFWSPFRSEIAASGFVDQLQRVTGLDYRVVKIKPGVYEVAFAYIDDAEITDNLTQITAATGLQLPEG